MGIPSTGKQTKVTGIVIHRIADGNVEETWINWDTPGLAATAWRDPADGVGWLVTSVAIFTWETRNSVV
jgi:hypothetical protein